MYFSFKFNFGNDPTVSAPDKGLCCKPTNIGKNDIMCFRLFVLAFFSLFADRFLRVVKKGCFVSPVYLYNFPWLISIIFLALYSTSLHQLALTSVSLSSVASLPPSLSPRFRSLSLGEYNAKKMIEIIRKMT